LMRREPVMLFEGSDAAAGGFYDLLADDCDLKGTNLTEFFRRRFVGMLVCGASYIAVEFPRSEGSARTRAEEDSSGQSRAYLVDYGADEVINWSYDQAGGLDWVVIRTSVLQQSQVSDSAWERETRWIHYDREHYHIYRRRGENTAIEDIGEGRHGLASLRRVPLFELRVTDGLWLMNKAASLQMEHFNKSNALSWALHMGLFAMPVIYSEREWRQIVGEAYYIQLGPEDKFGWTEPEGHVYRLAAENLERLKDEIYRVCYLITHAGGREARNIAQSAASKQRDQVVTHEVLRAYGDLMKEFMRQTLEWIAKARQDDVKVDVTGLDQFDVKDFTEELANAQILRDLVSGSSTFTREMQKRLALKYLEDSSQELKSRIAGEIDSRL